MKKISLSLTLLCVFTILHAQQPYVYTLKADSVKITNSCDTAELILENRTQQVNGFLFNKGNGRTEFRKPLQLNDSMLVMGYDTFLIRGTGNWWSVKGNGGTTQANNFIGTTDNVGLVFRTNNTPRLTIANNAMLHQMGYYGLHIYDTVTKEEGGISLYAAAPVRGRITFGRYGGIRTTGTIAAGMTALTINTGSAKPVTGTVNALVISGQLLTAAGNAEYNSVRLAGIINHGDQGVGIARGLYIDQELVTVNNYRALEVEKGKTLLKDTLALPNILSKSDTATYKPLAIDASGNIVKMTAWKPAGSRVSITVAGASYTVPANVDVVFVNYSTGQATITLPAGTLDREITIKNLSSSNTVLLSGLDTNESNSLATRGAITVKYTGSSWMGISRY